MSKNVKQPGFLLLNIIITSIPFLLLSPAIQLKFSGFVQSITREHLPSLSPLIIIIFVCVQVPASLQLHAGAVAAVTGASLKPGEQIHLMKGLVYPLYRCLWIDSSNFISFPSLCYPVFLLSLL